MKMSFEEIMDYRVHVADKAGCPYDQERRHQLAYAAIERARADSVSGGRHWGLRYAAAACVAVMLGWVAYQVVLPGEDVSIRSTEKVNGDDVIANITNMLDYGMHA